MASSGICAKNSERVGGSEDDLMDWYFASISADIGAAKRRAPHSCLRNAYLFGLRCNIEIMKRAHAFPNLSDISFSLPANNKLSASQANWSTVLRKVSSKYVCIDVGRDC